MDVALKYYLEYLQQFVKDLPTSDERICYAMGYDCGINGADEKNCHFSLFSSIPKTRAWEAGKKQAEQDKAEKAQE